ncbi:anaerobic ribonucleoside-triphosphate reductase activating protein [Clostridium celatum]|uniref:Anaerobic ribonucleoside-triphosphate reductase-activating protein n=1 Tax=Clostridium celatum DSM 1785 TaxID=545697 RepID=L1QK15_9CLOT|nr:anaerobic ribonucleoside-triphosphate reductase activating protein [Clostridium celatum]EKY27922.1 anaerobic ribonucleoside-triphosphate reductase activating protein [Clostridium celatum DSM 1785]MCE9656835.1 anaerobic ribonucleoside-triphosphate reductase activating protein [Clostridium celatum]MDU2265032.1 anaerobic ribonucleoside-triphosphate reductase activating protein [Clostridium celatum]MDU6294524.1 anaerobic ribonucleoside-triphosphate reductase activating protein [Clostridium celat
MKRYVRLAGIAYESLVNGPGMRRVYFAQGCKHNCEGCFNKETHDFNGGELKDMDELIKDALSNPMLKGITFSGGDPLEQSESFAYMAKKFKEAGLNIWCYTGYTFEQVLENMKKDSGLRELISNIDVLVDGRFELKNKKEELKFKGSSNQRTIDVKRSLNSREIIVLE